MSIQPFISIEGFFKPKKERITKGSAKRRFPFIIIYFIIISLILCISLDII